MWETVFALMIAETVALPTVTAESEMKEMRSVNILEKNSRFSGRRALSFICAVIFSLSLISELGSLSPANAASAAPDVEDICLINTDPAVVYILTPVSEANVTYRVYKYDKNKKTSGYKGVKLGETYVSSSGSACCVVPLSRTISGTGESARIVVTRQADGETESSSRILERTYAPYQKLTLKKIDENVTIPSSYSGSGFELETIEEGGAIVKDSFYQVDVRLCNFEAIDSVTLPIRYDTSVFEPAAISGGKVVTADPDYLTAAKNGTTFHFPERDDGGDNSNQYGIKKGISFDDWHRAGSSDYPYFLYGGSYQYINTTTGLIRLQAGVSEYGKQKIVQYEAAVERTASYVKR